MDAGIPNLPWQELIVLGSNVHHLNRDRMKLMLGKVSNGQASASAPPCSLDDIAHLGKDEFL
jgi:hypothetical protein